MMRQPPGGPGLPPLPPPPPLGSDRRSPTRFTFTDRVMASVAAEPRPTPGRAFVAALSRLAWRDAFAAAQTAWRIAFRPTNATARTLRVQALALLLGIFVVIGVGGPFAALEIIDRFGLVGPQGPVAPAAPSVGPERSPEAQQLVVVPTPSPTPTATDKPRAEDRPRKKRATPAPTVKPKVKATRTPSRRARATPEPEDREKRAERKEPRETKEPREREREHD